MKINPSIFVKVNFGENLRRFTKNSSHLYKNYLQFTLDALKNYFSHLVAVENAKTKRGERKYSLLNSLGKGKIRRRFSKMPSFKSLGKSKTVPYFQNLPPASKKKKPLSRRGNHTLIAAQLYIFKILQEPLIFV